MSSEGNRIILSHGLSDLAMMDHEQVSLQVDRVPLANSPTSTSKFHITLQAPRKSGRKIKYISNSSAVGFIFVRPSTINCSGPLELVIWGSTLDMLAQASRLAPLMTGTGQPDFVVVDESAKWRGADAAGLAFFDAHWELADSVGFH